MTLRWSAALVCIGLGVCMSCTNAELCVAPCMDPVPPATDNVVRFEGNACTVAPAEVTFPYKILFVIDVSGSNENSDPEARRADAVQQVIEQYGNNPAISFGVVRFSTDAERVTPLFTNDVDTLVATAIPPLRENLNSTGYIAALQTAREFLEEDMRSLSTSELSRTRYDVQFLSDGVPNPCIPVATVEAATKDLLKLRDTMHPFELKLSTTQLTYAGFVSDCQYGDPPAFLRPMAELGNGTFQELSSSQLHFNIAFIEILRRFESHDFYVVNLSRVVWNDALWPDSDRDGIRDADDPNPTSADSDKDGCEDKVNDALLPNQGLCHSQCLAVGLDDRDADGLPDCAEASLGYDAASADSDRDGFTDDLELQLGSNPLDVRTLTTDTDLDGVVDAVEMRTGTNPSYPEGGRDWAYIYSALTPSKAKDPGTSCFKFDVENVRLVETLATDSSAAGDNVICIYSMQKPIDAPDGNATVTRSCTTVNYRRTPDGGDTKTPADGNISITPNDFGIAYK